LARRYQVFAGPKDSTLLETYGLTGSLYFGWPIFEWVAKPLSVILHTFYSAVRNYGIAIIMLTILVRSCMFPLSRRAAIMGQRMQEMQPEMKRINELYKDDMNKRGQEIQALYKKYKLNPMASCLPVFIQIPIFIGLYRCVSTDIALRQQPLIPGLGWCSNLAGPDMLASFPSWVPDFIAGKGTGWFGPYLNLLPIITITLFIIQQKVLMPKATDEQTRMTQQMMMVMTVFMGVLFFKVPAGLCIYFITSSIWSLVERRLIKKFTPAMPVGAEVAAVSAPAIASQNPRPKTNTKPPETIADVMDSLKNLWNQRRPSADAKPPVVPPSARRKQRKKNP
jgi:YidC/Oxa1 family membrane protein insertase